MFEHVDYDAHPVGAERRVEHADGTFEAWDQFRDAAYAVEDYVCRVVGFLAGRRGRGLGREDGAADAGVVFDVALDDGQVGIDGGLGDRVGFLQEGGEL